MTYMVPPAPDATAGALPDQPRPRSYTHVQPRWPMFLSVFGALAVSLLLWAGIAWGIGLVIDWVAGPG